MEYEYSHVHFQSVRFLTLSISHFLLKVVEEILEFSVDTLPATIPCSRTLGLAVG